MPYIVHKIGDSPIKQTLQDWAREPQNQQHFPNKSFKKPYCTDTMPTTDEIKRKLRKLGFDRVIYTKYDLYYMKPVEFNKEDLIQMGYFKLEDIEIVFNYQITTNRLSPNYIEYKIDHVVQEKKDLVNKLLTQPLSFEINIKIDRIESNFITSIISNDDELKLIECGYRKLSDENISIIYLPDNIKNKENNDVPQKVIFRVELSANEIYNKRINFPKTKVDYGLLPPFDTDVTIYFESKDEKYIRAKLINSGGGNARINCVKFREWYDKNHLSQNDTFILEMIGKEEFIISTY